MREVVKRAVKAAVLSRLAEIDFPRARTRIQKGWFRETLSGGELPSKRGRIVVDDYACFSAGAKRAVDPFVASKNGRFRCELPLPFTLASRQSAILAT